MTLKTLRPLVFGLAVLLSLGLLAFTLAYQSGGAQPPQRSPMNSPQGGDSTADSRSWADVKRLIDEQKYNEALELVGKLRESARARNDADKWKRGLILEV